MVAEEYDHGRLTALLIVGHQLLQSLVALQHQGEVLLRGVVRLTQLVGYGHRLLQVVPTLGVAAVVLHGDVKDKLRIPLLRIGDLEDGLIIRLVGDVIADEVGVIHVLLVELVIKAHIVVYDRPVPSRGLIGVEGGALVAVDPQQGCQGGHPLLGVELIGHGVRRLEDGSKASEVFKLHAGGAPSGDGGVHPALDGVLAEGVEEGRGVLGDLQLIKDGQIGEGLVHDHNNVDGLRSIRVALHTGVLIHQL